MVAVIGDIHGCYNTLESLYKKIQGKYPDIPVYCVGDLVDRGNFSFEVVEFFIKNNLPFTPGNHDYMFYAFFKEPNTLFAKSWVYNGNEATLRSYLNFHEQIDYHLAFIKSAPLYFNTEDCFISHAGISSHYKSTLQNGTRNKLEALDSLIKSEFDSESGILWTRDRLLNLGKLQVVGHTKQYEVKLDSKANAIYIDTGACVGNKLSSVIIRNSEIVEIIAEPTHQEDIALI